MSKDGKEMLKRHEGLRLKFYKDTEGIYTIGYGHNLEANGVSLPTAEFIFEEDYAKAEAGARKLINNWDTLDERRRDVLINMTFQMGYDGMRQWVNTLAAIERRDFSAAARGMANSKWFRQVPKRARELIRIMEEG